MRSLDPPLVPTPAPEPAYCPRCGLRHTRRADWMCPRCGSPVDSEVPPPQAPPAGAAARPGFPLPSRLAGALALVAAGALATATARGFAALPAGAYRLRLLAVVVALTALGLGLLLKRASARWAAVALAAVAAAVLVEGLLRDLAPGLVRDPLPAPVRQLLRDLVRDHRPLRVLPLLGFDAGALLLLVGRPRAVRLAAGLALAAPLLVLELVAALGR